MTALDNDKIEFFNRNPEHPNAPWNKRPSKSQRKGGVVRGFRHNQVIRRRVSSGNAPAVETIVHQYERPIGKPSPIDVATSLLRALAVGLMCAFFYMTSYPLITEAINAHYGEGTIELLPWVYWRGITFCIGFGSILAFISQSGDFRAYFFETAEIEEEVEVEPEPEITRPINLSVGTTIDEREGTMRTHRLDSLRPEGWTWRQVRQACQAIDASGKFSEPGSGLGKDKLAQLRDCFFDYRTEDNEPILLWKNPDNHRAGLQMVGDCRIIVKELAKFSEWDRHYIQE